MKLNRLRNFALGLMFVAFLVMYLSTFGAKSPATHFLLPIGIVGGVFIAIIAMFIYFRIGAISMRAPKVDCPQCGRTTKILGATDRCAYCKQPLRISTDKSGTVFAEKID